jgi:hypothetical protein
MNTGIRTLSRHHECQFAAAAAFPLFGQQSRVADSVVDKGKA